MKRLIITTALAAAAAGYLTGCETKAREIQETQAITTVGGIDIQDWNKAANDLSMQLLASPALASAPRQPAVLAISRFINNTTTQCAHNVSLNVMDFSAVIRFARENNVGLVVIGPEDPLAAGIAQERAILNPNNPAAAAASPDYTLTGKIIQVQARAGNMRQSTFAFQMSLTDLRSGLAVWEGEKQIIKQGTKAGVGF